jgi:hypothetical protein
MPAPLSQAQQVKGVGGRAGLSGAETATLKTGTSLCYSGGDHLIRAGELFN